MRRLLVVLTILIVSNTKVSSTHLVGGELYYKLLSGGKIEITLVVYRECFNGVPAFDQPAYVSLFDTAGNRLKDYALNNPVMDTIVVVDSSHQLQIDSCVEFSYRPSLQYCYEKGVYTLIDSLPFFPGGAHLAYDRCCLANPIINIDQPLSHGFALTCFIPDQSLSNDSNSSPRFVSDPPILICTSNLYSHTFEAQDVDGDSISYEWVTPFDVSSIFNSHTPPIRIPDQLLPYAQNFSLTYAFGPYYPVQFNDTSGLMEIVPCLLGSFQYGVRVHEYRNGNYLGYMERVFRFLTAPSENPDTTFINCPQNQPPPPIGMVENNILDFRIYPNPSNGVFNVKLENENSSYMIIVYSLNGEELYSSSIGGANGELDLSDLPDGMYFVQLNTGQNLTTQKIIKASR